jgi:hypothetical protein
MMDGQAGQVKEDVCELCRRMEIGFETSRLSNMGKETAGGEYHFLEKVRFV